MCDDAERLDDAEGIGKAMNPSISARSVLRGFERGLYPGYRVSPRRIRFKLSEVLAAVKEQR